MHITHIYTTKHMNTHTLKRIKIIYCVQQNIYTEKWKEYIHKYINTLIHNTCTQNIQTCIAYIQMYKYTFHSENTNIDAELNTKRKIRYKRMTDILSSSNSICPVHLFSGFTNT